eukprot:1372140-Pyramimonas_sp.AAC.1
MPWAIICSSQAVVAMCSRGAGRGSLTLTVPSSRPSLNCLRTSSITALALCPTASMVSPENTSGSMPPISMPGSTCEGGEGGAEPPVQRERLLSVRANAPL